MSDLFPAHMQARTALRELVTHTAAIYLLVSPSLVPGRPELVLPSLLTFHAGCCSLVTSCEEGNPHDIEKKEKPAFHRKDPRGTILPRNLARILSLPVSLSDLVNHMFMTYSSTNSVGMPEKVMSILRAGIGANHPGSSISLHATS